MGRTKTDNELWEGVGLRGIDSWGIWGIPVLRSPPLIHSPRPAPDGKCVGRMPASTLRETSHVPDLEQLPRRHRRSLSRLIIKHHLESGLGLV